MGTTYIPRRDAKQVTRAQVLKKFKCYLSDDDKKAKKTLQTASHVGIDAGGSYCWVSFHNDVVSSVDTYGIGNDVSAYEDKFGTLICEHDDDFSYHRFPVDTKDPNVKPVVTKGDWEVFADGEWGVLYNRKTDSHYEHIAQKLAELNIDEMIEEAE